MNAIEIRNLRKSFGEKQALIGLDMTVPEGSIYGFIGENGSGKSTTEKIICGLIHESDGTVKLFGEDHNTASVREKMGVLIEAPGCFPGYRVWDNMLMHAKNLGLDEPEQAVIRALKTVRMEGAASNKYKNCSLGMKQRVGIAMALLGEPKLLVLDEPINGLDADGTRIMREVLTDITKNHGCTVLVSSHILGELEKIATHYGIIRGGKMICEMTAEQLEADCPTYVAVMSAVQNEAIGALRRRYARVERDEAEYIRIYDAVSPEEVIKYLYENGIVISEIKTEKIGLEEYYINLMKEAR